MKFLLIAILSVFTISAQAKQSLLPAIEQNDLATVEKLIKAGADVNDETGLYTPLVRAIHMESPEMVDLLLNNKANPNLPGPYSRLPMDWAIQGRQLPIMDLLRKKDADLNLLSSNNSLLELAFESLADFNSEPQQTFQKESYEWLLKNGLDLNKNKETYADILAAAARSGDKALVKDLFTRADFKSSVNTYDRNGGTALIAAIFNYRYEHEVVEVVRTLLENGANPNLKDDDGKSPLASAKVMNRKRIAKLLIDAGAKE